MRELLRRRRLRKLQQMRRRHAYAYRGARERQSTRGRRLALAAALCASAAVALRAVPPDEATAASARPAPVARLLVRRPSLLHADAPVPHLARVEVTRGLGHRERARLNRVHRYATRYGIATDLAADIHDAAVAEGLEPELAFRLVHTESEFNERATSPVGAAGLTQLMLGTARYYAGPVTRERLYDRQLNLRVGFRYLRGLVREYKSLRLALLVYNRGPRAVRAAMADGRDPANGYEKLVMKGYRGRGTVD